MAAGLTATYCLGANRFSTVSVVCLAVEGTPPQMVTRPLRHALDAHLAVRHVLDLGPSVGVTAVRNNADAPFLVLAAALAQSFLRKSGVEVQHVGVIGGRDGTEAGSWFEISDLKQGMVAAEAALKTATAVLRAGEDLPGQRLAEIVTEAQDAVDRACPAPFAELVLAAADRRGIPWRHNSARQAATLAMGSGARSRWFHQSFFEGESKAAFALTQNKMATSLFLREAGIPVPDNRSCQSIEEAELAAEAIGFPVVVKPLKEGRGRGTTVDIRDVETLRKAFPIAAQYKSAVIVEEFVSGRDYRILVVDGRAVNCALRKPPIVFGDGEHTISELCAIENCSPDRGKQARFATNPIDLALIESMLTTPYKARGIGLDSVPTRGDEVRLAYPAVDAIGRTVEDATSRVHPDYMRMAERASRLSGLRVCGVDLIASDITRPVSEAPYWINELNNHTALAISHFPGGSERVADVIVSSVFPGDRDYRVPVVAVVSGRDCSALVRAMARGISATGNNAAAVHCDGYEVGGLSYGNGDFANLEGRLRAFGDRSAEAIVVECRPEELSVHGFGINYADVVVAAAPDDAGETFWRQVAFLGELAGTAIAIERGQGGGPGQTGGFAGAQAVPPEDDAVVAAVLKELAAQGLR